MKRGSFLVLAAVAMVFAYLAYYTFSSPYKVSSEEANRLLREKKVDVVLDVRTKMEYNLGHYPEALHIPTANLAYTAETLLPNKNTPILVYCNTGQRARYATDLLVAKGYTNVKYIAGTYLTLTR